MSLYGLGRTLVSDADQCRVASRVGTHETGDDRHEKNLAENRLGGSQETADVVHCRQIPVTDTVVIVEREKYMKLDVDSAFPKKPGPVSKLKKA